MPHKDRLHDNHWRHDHRRRCGIVETSENSNDCRLCASICTKNHDELTRFNAHCSRFIFATRVPSLNNAIYNHGRFIHLPDRPEAFMNFWHISEQPAEGRRWPLEDSDGTYGEFTRIKQHTKYRKWRNFQLTFENGRSSKGTHDGRVTKQKGYNLENRWLPARI